MDPNKKSEHLARLEALLFIHGEPLPQKKIEKLLNVESGELVELLGELDAELGDVSRGLHLVRHEEKVQLATKPEFHKLGEDFIKDELSEDLTPASLETLSIITYLGPISRSKLEYIRGVNSVFTLRNLRLRGLVDRHLDPKNQLTYLYEPSFELLKHLGIKRKDDLPEYEKFKELLEAGSMPPPSAPDTSPPSEVLQT